MPKSTKGGASNAWEPEHPPEILGALGGDFGPDDGPEEEDAWGAADGYDSWTVAALQEELVLRSLPKSGTKAELVERLRQADGTSGS